MSKEPSARQWKVLAAMAVGDVKSAYGARAPLPVMRALVTKGYLQDVTPPGPGSMFSPATHYQFKRIK